LDGVLEALASNRQQLQHNLRRGLAPFAHVGGGGGGTKAAAAAAVAGQQQQQQQQWGGWNLFGGGKGEAAAAVAEAHPPVPGDAEILCFEYTKGKRRLYSPAAPSSAPSADAALSTGSSSSSSDGGFAIADDAVQHRQRVRDLLADYLLPQGFPESVAPEYSDYMRARSFQYFFGGGCWQGRGAGHGLGWAVHERCWWAGCSVGQRARAAAWVCACRWIPCFRLPLPSF
jgi:hypothetical protein